MSSQDNSETNSRPHRGRNFLALVFTYSLGTFNDNFYKQVVLLLAVSVGLSTLQGWGTVIFGASYMFVAAWAGWWADRFSKKKVIIWAKVLELIAMAIGALGFYLFSPSQTGSSLSWILIFVMLSVMAAQSSIFSPALNGTIPEIYEESYIATANGIVKVFSTIAILVGVYLGGLLLNGVGKGSVTYHEKLIPIAIVVIAVAIFGFLFSFIVPKSEARGTKEKFPVLGPIQSFIDLYNLRKDFLLKIIIFASILFWFVGAFQIQLLNEMGENQFHWEKSMISMLIVAQMVGVAIGAVLAGYLDKGGKNWYRVLAPALFIMGLSLLALGFLDLIPSSIRYYSALSFLAIEGVAGGLYLIPIESFVQIRPKASKKGKVIAAHNFADFIGVIGSGFAFSFLYKLGVKPTGQFVITACLCFFVMFILILKLWKHEFREGNVYKGGTKLMDRFMGVFGRTFLRLRYRIKVKGVKEILSKGPAEKLIFVANHIALIDPVIISTHLNKHFTPRIIATEKQLQNPIVRWVVERFGGFAIPDMVTAGKKGAEKTEEIFSHVASEIEKGSNLLIYPSGRLKRQHEEKIGATSGVHSILQKVPDARVIFLNHNGLWGSLFSFGQGKPNALKILKTMLSSIFLNLFFFMPRRKVTVDLYEDLNFPKNADKMTINRYMEDYYNKNNASNFYVPYLFWKRNGGKHQLKEIENEEYETDVSGVPDQTKELILNFLKNMTGIENINAEMTLNYDLGLDSLVMLEVVDWLHSEFGYAPSDMESVQTVADLMLVAMGHGAASHTIRLKKVSDKWFNSHRDASRTLPNQKPTLLETFLHYAKSHKKKVMVADQISGEKTYQDIVLAIMVLKPFLEKIKENKIALMFPASVGATTFFIASLFAKKTPFMVNWTTGLKNVLYALESMGIKKVITSKALVHKLASGGIDLSELNEYFYFVEDLAKEVSLFSKIKALIKSKVSWKSLSKVQLSKDDTAVILSTSGSESNPKLVPLSHENIIYNINDLIQFFKLYHTDILMGILPPFHSYGLLVGTIAPLVVGISALYHPNPNDSLLIVRTIEAYKPTILAATPAFMKGILRSSDKETLKSLRIIVTAAEKCPSSLYDRMKKDFPNTVVTEAYGITECSPVVAANDLENPVPYSIGNILPGIEYILKHPEKDEIAKKGEKGILLVRGKSIFNGYLNHNGESPFIELEGKTWYNTSDIVIEDENKVLFFAGRQKRFIKVGGEMISLPAIEDVLKPHFTDENDSVSIAVETAGDSKDIVLFTTMSDLDRAHLNQIIRDSGLSPLHNIKKIIKIDEIPLLGSGKTDYKILKNMI